MKETTFRRKLCKELRAAGAVVIPIVGSTTQYSGVPDIYCSHSIWRGWIEFKGDRTKLQTVQSKVMTDLILTGTPCFIVRSPDRIQNAVGVTLDYYYSDARDLLEKLRRLTRENWDLPSRK